MSKKEKMQTKAKGKNEIERVVNGEPLTACKINLTDKERGVMIEYVEAKARSRKNSIGKLDDADFFCGAMSLMYALGMEPPTGWIFGIMSNRPEMYGMGDKNAK